MLGPTARNEALEVPAVGTRVGSGSGKDSVNTSTTDSPNTDSPADRRLVVRAAAAVRDRARDQGLEAVTDPGARARLAGSRIADRLERTAQTVRDVGRGIDQRAVEI